MANTPWNWTALHAEHVTDVLRLITDIETADSSPIRTTLAEVESYFRPSHVWSAQGAWVNSELIAFGLARTPVVNNGQQPITISGGVVSYWREHGLGTQLLERQLGAARIVAQRAGIESARARMYVDAEHRVLLSLAQELGFQEESRFVQMRRDLAQMHEVVELSPYMHIVPLSSEWVNDARKAHNRVLARTPAWSKHNKAMWSARLDSMRGEWCLAAVDMFGDRPRLAGYLLASGFASAVSPQGHDVIDEGYVEEIVVLPDWRGKHVATSLIMTAMDRFRSAGLSFIGIDVDIVSGNNGEQLVTVFEHFGFQRVAQTNILTIDV
ncbi:GNAT family N-acetyltransferase [Trueperella sp. LYQ143]|uniref:GNAT family N-acetyltransferase n=1 Tax=unclassified Trueperella TaxID=2630174 RepID=UPI0039839116